MIQNLSPSKRRHYLLFSWKIHNEKQQNDTVNGTINDQWLTCISH